MVRALALPSCGVPSMFDSLEVEVLYPARWWRRVSEAQGRRREAGSEGSAEQNRGLMDKNRIGGLPARTSEPQIAKSTTIKGRGGKSGRRAAKAVELTSGDQKHDPDFARGPLKPRNPRPTRTKK